MSSSASSGDWETASESEAPRSGPAGVVAIEYAPADEEALARARALLAAGDVSAAAQDAATEAIGVNPADYGSWQLRWRCTEAAAREAGPAAERVWLAERGFADAMAARMPKNYQVWNHRRKVVGALGGRWVDEDLAGTEGLLASGDDAKNYHAWAHRQALVSAFGRWDGELEVCDRLLAQDVRNNSAWSHRAFVMARHPGHAAMGAEEWAARVAAEVDYVAEQIRSAFYNESAWGYLWGLSTLPRVALTALRGVPALAAEAIERYPGCPPALSTLGLYLEALAGELERAGDGERAGQARARAREVAEGLRGSDAVRRFYWEQVWGALGGDGGDGGGGGAGGEGE